MKKYLILLLAVVFLTGCGGVNDARSFTIAKEYTTEEVAEEVVEEVEIRSSTYERETYEKVWINITNTVSKDYFLDDYRFDHNDMVEVKCHNKDNNGNITRYEFLVHRSNVTFMTIDTDD